MSNLPYRADSASAGPRKKTTEACNPCRARKSKCNGSLPCYSCEKNGVQCAYDSSTGTSKFSQGLDTINARVLELERAVFGERTYQHPCTHTPDRTSSSVYVHSSNGSLTFYGPTSTMVLLKEVESKLTRPDLTGNGRSSPRKRLRLQVQDESNSNNNFPSTSQRDDRTATGPHQAAAWSLREGIATAHLECFFQSTHDILPVLGVPAFQAAYNSFWNGSHPRPAITQSYAWQALLYSILALGALRSTATDDALAWADNYFEEAQDRLKCMLGMSCVETVQATMFMAIYAYSIDNANLAYNYLGIAIRTAYSIGINRNLEDKSREAVDLQPARCTWWILYSLESQLCIEYGKPLSIRERDARADYPYELPVNSTANASKLAFITVSAKFSRIARKIIDLISDISETKLPIQSFVGRLMNHQAELMTWRGELPAHLAPRERTPSAALPWEDAPWMQAQRCDLELRFNNLMLVMHRPFYANTEFTTPFYTSSMARTVCLGAARETILTIHNSLNGNGNGPDIDECSGYYHRALASTLVLLHSTLDSTDESEKASLTELCSKSMEIFRRMNPPCAKTGITLLQSAFPSLPTLLSQSARLQTGISHGGAR
ncbi:fungal-specific transcription factor domain-containing protein [Aspergillus pseudoustus]|uniref:Fungal-specific transcription factor domain-containing protein n=1 Tax=Aspergillus pseudoustus TaxID=1810923 RepID=A0ABR4ILA8_9EURO